MCETFVSMPEFGQFDTQQKYFGRCALYLSPCSSVLSTIRMHKVVEQVHCLPGNIMICSSPLEKLKHTDKIWEFLIRSLSLFKSPLSCLYKKLDTTRTVCFTLIQEVGLHQIMLIEYASLNMLLLLEIHKTVLKY